MQYDTPEPFKVDIPERALIDLDERLRRWKPPVAIEDRGSEGGSWAAGTDPDVFILELPPSRLQTTVPEQAVWVTAAQMLRSFTTAGRPAPPASHGARTSSSMQVPPRRRPRAIVHASAANRPRKAWPSVTPRSLRKPVG